MIKLLGVLFVTVGCGMCGWYFSDRFLGRVHLLEEWQQLIQYLYGEIEYSECDIYEILCKLSGRCRYSRSFWLSTAKDIEKHNGLTFSGIWKSHISEIELWNFLKDDEREIIESLGDNIGSLDRETQLHTLKIFQNRLSFILSKAKEEYAVQARLSHVICITVGIFISVLLI